MLRNEILATLRRHEQALRERGVRHAALFGSTARGSYRPDSDIDIMVELRSEEPLTVYDYVALKEYIARLFDRPVDVIDRSALKPHLRKPAADEALYAF